jgi:hypothetical protein
VSVHVMVCGVVDTAPLSGWYFICFSFGALVFFSCRESSAPPESIHGERIRNVGYHKSKSTTTIG